MKYRSYTAIIFAFNLLFLAASMFLYYKLEGRWYFAILPFALITIALLVFRTPIDRYFFKFQEVGIDEKIYALIRTEYPEIANFTAEQTRIFTERMFYFLYNRESYLVTEETEELELFHTVLICAPAVIMSMKGDTDEGEDINRIAAYRHAFPSPKMKFIHSAEYDGEDGVMIVSIEQLMTSLRKRNSAYHIAYHIWAERYISRKPGFPEIFENFAEKIPAIFGFTKLDIDNILGYDVQNTEAIALTAFFNRTDAFQRELPVLYQQIDKYTRA